jgi:CubicO group peptidase (beta-lactamase class C family)
MQLAERAAQHREEVGLPALAVAVIRSDGIDAAVVGRRRLDSDEPAQERDRFHLGSNTKAMTATLAAILVERGLIAWDTRAGEALSIDQAHPDVTLTTLLTHAAGVRPLEEDEELAALNLAPGSPTEQRLMTARILLEDEPAFAPGTAHRYSNGGYAIAAAMLEQVADTPWEALISTEIFEPLGMDATLGWPARHGAPQPWGHTDEGGELRPHDPDGSYRLGAEAAPAGDVNASIRSYAEFVRMHLRGLQGIPGLVGVETFRHLHTADQGYAYGWGVQQFEGTTTSVHSGSADTFYAVVVLQAERDLAVAAVTNAAGERAQSAVVELTREVVREHSAEAGV